MKKIITTVALLVLPLIAYAAPIQFSVSTTVSAVEGTYAGDVSAGQTITGTFIVDDNSLNAGPGSDPNPSLVPGHEYTAFWEFPGHLYTASVFNVDLGGGFTTIAPPHLVMNDGLAMTAEQTGGIIADGIYDWIELNASSTIDYCPEVAGCTEEEYIPASGEEWVLAIFSDTSWFSGGEDIPSALPASYTAFIIGIEVDAVGEEIGLVLATADSISVTAVPLPAGAWMFLSALLGMSGLRLKMRSESGQG